MKERIEILIKEEQSLVEAVGSELIEPIKLFDLFEEKGKHIFILEAKTSGGLRYIALYFKEGLKYEVLTYQDKYFLHVRIYKINRLRVDLSLSGWRNIQQGYRVLNENWKSEKYYDFGQHGGSHNEC